MSELNIPGFIAFLRGEVTIDGHWFGGDGPIRGGIRRNFWWREHLPKLSAHIERQDAEIAQLRADLSESRRLLDEARAQKPAIFFPRQPNGDGGWVIDANYVAAIRKDCFPIEWQPCEEEVEAVLLAVERAAPAPAQPAAAKGSTHCGECGCDWLDNGLNPVGCPYCKRNDDKFNPCLNSLVRQVTLMMDDCEEHADGSITIDCDISQGFLRRIYDLLSALEDGGYDAMQDMKDAGVYEEYEENET